jgi:beta-lactamase class A
MFAKLDEYISTLGGTAGIVARDLRSGDTAAVNADVVFPAASIIKLPILWEFYRQEERKGLDPQKIHSLKNSEKAGASCYDCGVLREMHDGLALTLTDLLTLMVIISDDTATNILIDTLTMDGINQAMEELGLKHTKIQRKMMDYEKVYSGIDNLSCAGDMDTLLAAMLAETAPVAKSRRDMMLGLMAKQQINTAIPLFLSSDLRIAHKTGSIIQFSLEHDVGIVYDKNLEPAVAVSVFTRNLADSKNVIGRIAKLAYGAYLSRYEDTTSDFMMGGAGYKSIDSR